MLVQHSVDGCVQVYENNDDVFETVDQTAKTAANTKGHIALTKQFFICTFYFKFESRFLILI